MKNESGKGFYIVSTPYYLPIWRKIYKKPDCGKESKGGKEEMTFIPKRYSWEDRGALVSRAMRVLEFVHDRLTVLGENEEDMNKGIELDSLAKWIDGVYGELYVASRTANHDWKDVEDEKHETDSAESEE